jgi:hypothetical protein
MFILLIMKYSAGQSTVSYLNYTYNVWGAGYASFIRCKKGEKGRTQLGPLDRASLEQTVLSLLGGRFWLEISDQEF